MKKINTFNGWKEQGRVVIRGQKAYLIDGTGECWFYENQTTPITVEDEKCTKAKAFMKLWMS